MKLKTGDALLKEAQKLGVSTSEIGGPENWAELQTRVMEAKRFKRESLAWAVALASAIASAFSAAAAWYAIVSKIQCP
ncbi:hypothetical protein [Desulfobulbus propionicus]|jgi:hypothetical protein|uniref:hypothetical protein n=1 Tax=Desulfobulbus propionicus TaxID=894 RepID=UPI00146C5562|nr:hypothetical protein [Desulfobulbus propionicus]